MASSTRNADRGYGQATGLRRLGGYGVQDYCVDPKIWAGVAQLVELQPSKLNVASSSLVSRSIDFERRSRLACPIDLIFAVHKAHVAQSVERFLGKEEVHRFDSDRGLHKRLRQDKRTFSITSGGRDGEGKI